MCCMILYFGACHSHKGSNIDTSQEIKLEWRKGLVQKRAAEARLQELEEEKDKPFAGTRYCLNKK